MQNGRSKKIEMSLKKAYLFNKLGILDSGYGSLTVLDALLKEDIASQYVIYADNKNAPWGDKEESVLWPLVKKAVQFLKNQEIDALVLGCNTTDSLFAKRIAELVSVPVFGLISYGAIKAALLSQNKHIVPLATQQRTSISLGLKSTHLVI